MYRETNEALRDVLRDVETQAAATQARILQREAENQSDLTLLGRLNAIAQDLRGLLQSEGLEV